MIVVYGASGHAKEIALFLRMQAMSIDYFIDREAAPDSTLFGIPVIAEAEFVEDYAHYADIRFYIAIGAPQVRQSIVAQIKRQFPGCSFPNLIASTCLPDKELACNTLGEGNIFFPGSRLTTHTHIGNHNHFNLDVSVSHDVQIGDFNTFSPGVRIAGTVSMGSGIFWGVNALAIDKVSIADNCIIGAGAVIHKSITDSGTYVGVPAKKIK